jgi:hypothetical protein
VTQTQFGYPNERQCGPAGSFRLDFVSGNACVFLT